VCPPFDHGVMWSASASSKVKLLVFIKSKKFIEEEEEKEYVDLHLKPLLCSYH